MNLETAVVVYIDDYHVVYRDEGKLYEGRVETSEEKSSIAFREIDAYDIRYYPDGTFEWKGATINSGPIHANFSENAS